jgi:hypothetical protein
MNANSSIPALARRARTIAVALAIAGLSAGFVACSDDEAEDAVDDAQENIDSLQEEAEQQIDSAQEEGADIGDDAEQQIDEAQEQIDSVQDEVGN